MDKVNEETDKMGVFDFRNKLSRNAEIEENEQKPAVRFWRILYSKIWNLTKLNLLYLVFLLPTFFAIFLLSGIIVGGMFQNVQSDYGVFYEIFVRLVISSFFAAFWGAGPATAGITAVLWKCAKEEPSFIWSDFIDGIKTNFKQSLMVFAVDIVAFVVLYAAMVFYGSMSGVIGMAAFVVTASITLIYTMMHFYIYPVMNIYDMKLRHIYLNSLIYTIGKFPRNFMILGVLLFIHAGLVYLICNFAVGVLFLLLGIAIGYAFSGFVVKFNVYENMRKYIEK